MPKICLCVFGGHFLWGRKTHKQNPPQSWENLVKKKLMCFLFMFFFSPKSGPMSHDIVRYYRRTTVVILWTWYSGPKQSQNPEKKFEKIPNPPRWPQKYEKDRKNMKLAVVGPFSHIFSCYRGPTWGGGFGILFELFFGFRVFWGASVPGLQDCTTTAISCDALSLSLSGRFYSSMKEYTIPPSWYLYLNTRHICAIPLTNR